MVMKRTNLNIRIYVADGGVVPVEKIGDGSLSPKTKKTTNAIDIFS